MTTEIPPYAARPLTKSERRRGDLYVYNSPKAARRVEIIDCLRMALALRFEFDASTTNFVERPRAIEVHGKSFELDFWARDARGRERFWLLVAADDTIGPRSTRREYRQAREVSEGAHRANLSLEFCFEEELQKQAGTLATWYRLLPYVQAAQSLPNRQVLREQVISHLQAFERASFDQLEGALRGFHAADVRAIVVDLIHRGNLVLVDPTNLTRFSLVQRRAAHGE